MCVYGVGSLYEQWAYVYIWGVQSLAADDMCTWSGDFYAVGTCVCGVGSLCVYGVGSLYEQWAYVYMMWAVSMSSGHMCMWCGQFL